MNSLILCEGSTGCITCEFGNKTVFSKRKDKSTEAEKMLCNVQIL